MKSISSPHAPAAIGPYAQAVSHDGVLYASGQIGLVPETGELALAGVAAEAQQALRNLDAILLAAGANRNDVARCTVYLLDMQDFNDVNDVYAAFFGAHRPARSTIGVAGLPRGARVEIDLIAHPSSATRSADEA